jgi:lysozyme
MWTIGVGHVLYPEQVKLPVVRKEGYEGMLRGEYPLKSEDNRVWTMEEIDSILQKDLVSFERGVKKFCPVDLSQGMLDALVSFSFNAGLGALQRSSIRQKLLRGDKEGAADSFLLYTMGGGKVLKGLVNRRNDERALFLS